MDEKLTNNINTLGFLMTCFIVFYHIGSIEPPNVQVFAYLDVKANSLLNSFFSNMGGYAMCHFFSVTGFLLFYNLSYSNYLTKIKRRVFSLLVPYISWNLIIFFIYVVMRRYTSPSIKFFLFNTFCLVRWPFDGALWYVYAIFLMSICSPVLLFIYKNERTGWIFTVGIILFLEIKGFINNTLFQKIINYGFIPNILAYLPAFLIGAFWGRFIKNCTFNNFLKYIFSLIFISFLFNGIFQGFLNRTIIKILPFIWIFLLLLPKQLKNKKIYNLSFLMYAIHEPVIGEFRDKINYVLNKMGLPISLINVCEHIIVISLCIYSFLLKISPKILSLLTGGRYLKIKEEKC